jgi:hypothetical protein
MSGRPNSRNTRFNVAQKPRSQINASPHQNSSGSSGFLPKMIQTKSFQDLQRPTLNINRTSLEHASSSVMGSSSSNLNQIKNLNL